ncbi:MAG TPA: hypothetical protein VFV02_00710, partial [Acidimicrobiales bacterium]|nr:hypothetical protein [Acidimicrobiales bacterium]
AARESRDRMARVQVSDQTWSTFRAGLGSTPASVALGRLVEQEVASRRRRSASDSGSVHQAVEDARVVVAELTEMIEPLELRESGQAPRGAGALPVDVVFGEADG